MAIITPTQLVTEKVVNGVKLTWTDNSDNEYGFEVWSSLSGGTYALIATTARNITTYTHVCADGNDRMYKVRAKGARFLTDFTASVGYVALEAELQTYITGLTTPLSEGQKILLNNFILALKTGLSITNLSDYFDTMYIRAGETEESSLKNLVSDAYHATLVGTPAPTFVPFEGFTGDGAHGYINCNWNIANNKVRFTQNNCGYGIYIRNDVDENKVVSGGGRLGVAGLKLSARVSNIASFWINDHVADYHGFANTDSRGMYIITRDALQYNKVYAYKNKTSPELTHSGTNNSEALMNQNFYEMCYYYTTPQLFSTHQIAFTFTSKFVSTADRDVIVDAIEAYMDANGKGVI